MVTQAMILAAGKGTRLRPLTLTTPKPLVVVGGKPLIVWHIERLKRAGISRIVVNAGYLAEVLITALQTMELGVELLISDESGFAEPLETAGGIKYALYQQKLNDEPFILVNGDIWTSFNFSGLTTMTLDDERLGHLLLTDNPNHHPRGDFGLLAGKVCDDPSLPRQTFAGISVLSPRLFDTVTVGQVAPLAPILRQAIAKQNITGELIFDVWVDVGTPERLAMANAHARCQIG